MMIVGRVLLGAFAGCLFVVCPLYVGEIAEKEIRGVLGTFMQLMVTIGILFAYGVGAATSTFVFSIICMALPVLFGILFFSMPETPTYYIDKNKIPEAEKSLKFLRDKDYDPSKEIEILKIEKEDRERLNATKSLSKSFARRESKLSLLIVVGLMIFQQTSGINAVIFYTTTIFEAANTDIPPATQTIIVGVVQVVMTLVATLLVDKLGRKILLMTSDALMAICTIALGVFFYIKDNDPETAANLGWLPITSLCIFIVAYSIGFGPIPFLVLGEICAPDIKGVAVGTALTVNWTISFLITKFFINLVASLGIAGTFWIFSGFSLIGTCFITVVLPETKGISMEQIQLNLRSFKLFSF
jgi:sugar porter (SP) family MFS transporter